MRRHIVVVSIGVVVVRLAVTGTVAWYGSGVTMRSPGYEHRTPERGLRPIDPEGADFFIWHAAAGPSAELWVVDDANHAVLLDHAPDAYRAGVIGFLEQHLLQETGAGR